MTETNSFHILIAGIGGRQRSYHWLRLMTLGANRVTFGKNCERSLAFLSGHEVSLIMIDLDNTAYEGAKLLDHLAQHPHLKSAPLLVLTGKQDHDNLPENWRLIADAVLEKPVWYDNLKDEVARLTGRIVDFQQMPSAGDMPD